MNEASESNGPTQLGGIRNFGWVVPRVLARSGQPPLDDGSLEQVASLGIHTVVSLRSDGEISRDLTTVNQPKPYSADEEAAAVERAGLRFVHVPCEDLQAPRPDDIAAVLRALDEEAGANRVSLAHCLAGVGRTSVMTSGWLMSRGASGDDAAELHARFLGYLDAGAALPLEQRPPEIRLGRQYSCWAFLQVARALSQTVRQRDDLPEPVKPPNTDGWEELYMSALAPWRR
jgi:uncharacterized protein (TIGR01244 family)